MELEQPRKEKIRYAILIPIIVHQFLMASVTAKYFIPNLHYILPIPLRSRFRPK